MLHRYVKGENYVGDKQKNASEYIFGRVWMYCAVLAAP